MQLTGPQLKQLNRILAHAFPSYPELQRMVRFSLGVQLNTLVQSTNVTQAVFELVEWADTHGKMAELIKGAQGENTDHADLRAFAIEIGVIAAPPPTPTVSATATSTVPIASPPTYRTLIVDPLRRASNYNTISAAIFAARPGDRIMVRPGIYTEGLVISKPLEIIGDGNRAEIVVQASKKPVLLFQTSGGRVQNLTLRQSGGKSFWGDIFHAVDVKQGRLELEDCDISSASWACVAIHNGADPRLRRNRIHDGNYDGVVVYENGQGLLEDNDIFANSNSGMQISSGGNPTLRRNRIHANQVGVFIFKKGQGLLEDNDIFANAQLGVQISSGGNPTLRRNRIHDHQGGVLISENGQGLLEDNDIFANSNAGVLIKTGNPTLRGNRIHDENFGVMVFENGQGLLEDNDIFANSNAGVLIKTGNPTLRRNRVHKNGWQAIHIHDGGAGTFENNDLRGNVFGAWDLAPNCLPNVTRFGNIE